MLISNQYRVHPTIELRQTDYSSTAPFELAAQWRKGGWAASEHEGRVRVFHGPESPLPLEEAVASQLLPLSESDATLKALNGLLKRALVSAGYVAREDGKLTLFRAVQGESVGSPKYRSPKLYLHRTWTWEFQFQGDQCWLIPKPSLTKITELPAALFAQRFGHLEPTRTWSIIDPATGNLWTHQFLSDHAGAEWGTVPTARILYQPKTVADPSSTSVDEVHAAVQGEPVFQTLADTQHPRTIEPEFFHPIQEKRLLVRKTLIQERSQINHNRTGIHRKPLKPVQLQFVVPADDSTAVDYLTLRFAGENVLKARGLPRPEINVPGLWHSKWSLKAQAPLSWFSTKHSYDPQTGELLHPSSLEQSSDEARQSEGIQVTVAVLPDQRMSRKAFQQLRQELRPYNHVFIKPLSAPERLTTETPQQCWGDVSRIALKILRASGGLPFELAPVPGISSGRHYLGLDVGRNLKEGWSQVALVLVDWRGHVVAKRVEKFEGDTERIPTRVLTETLPEWFAELREVNVHDPVRRAGPLRMTQLVVHRDGRFVGEELEELVGALGSSYRLDLIEIKKDSPLRITTEVHEPHLYQVSPSTALIFNVSATQGKTRPLEIKVHGQTDLLEAARQVYWLSEMRTDELYRPGRLPITTFLADRIANTRGEG